MFKIGYFRDDKGHGEPIPTGAPVRDFVRQMLAMVRAESLRQLFRTGHVNLSHWLPTFTDTASPIIERFVVEGQRQRARKLLAQIERRPRKKSLSGPWVGGATGFPNLSFGFDVVNPMVAEFIRSATFNFVQSTLETAATDATQAYADVRRMLGQGLSGGETQRELNARMFKIFHDPMRASRIGFTEASRSIHAGGHLLAKQSGIVTGTRWLASSDACKEICQKLNGQERKLGDPFIILPKSKPPYNVVYHPPAHPWCACSDISLLTDDIPATSIAQLRTAAYDSSVPRRKSFLVAR